MLSKMLFSSLLALSITVLIVGCGRSDHDDEGNGRALSAVPAPIETAAPVQPAGKVFTYDFDKLPVSALPTIFSSVRTGAGSVGKWEILTDDSAPSKPNVLAQTSADSTDYRFPIVVSNERAFRDLELSVKFKAVGGHTDQAGGLVFRYKDVNNYYVVRANALENNFRLYHVVKGNRQQFAGANLPVMTKQWHELKVICIGNQITCFFDGKQAIQATDDTFKDAGKVGVWTKADSVTYFDDLTVTAK